MSKSEDKKKTRARKKKSKQSDTVVAETVFKRKQYEPRHRGRKVKPQWSARTRVEQLMSGQKPVRKVRAHHLTAKTLMSHEEAAFWAVRKAKEYDRPIEFSFRYVVIPVIANHHPAQVSARLRAICPEHDVVEADVVTER